MGGDLLSMPCGVNIFEIIYFLINYITPQPEVGNCVSSPYNL